MADLAKNRLPVHVRDRHAQERHGPRTLHYILPTLELETFLQYLRVAPLGSNIKVVAILSPGYALELAIS